MTDHHGDSEYSAQFELKLWRLGIPLASVALLVASVATNLWQARQPPKIYALGVDGTGQASAVRLNLTGYSPTEAEIRSRLEMWALYRFRLIKPLIKYNFKENYHFLAQQVATPLALSDPDITAKIEGGSMAEQDAIVNGVSFRYLDLTKHANGVVAKGECVIDLSKIYNVIGSGAKEHWQITVLYEVNPTVAARQSADFQLVNPSGVQITWFHEDKLL